MRRLEALPQSYLQQRDVRRRLRLTTDPETASGSLAEALEGRGAAEGGATAWPEVHFLGPQHPVLDWVSDRVLYGVERQHAPALVVDVATPTILISGVWANRMGEPIADAWLAATLEDGIVTFDDLFTTLERAGVSHGMVNTAQTAQLETLPALLAPILTATKQNLRDRLEDQVAAVKEKLHRTRYRLEAWQLRARVIVDQMPPGAHKSGRQKHVERVTKQIDELIKANEPTETPLLRVIAALLPRQEHHA